MFNERTKKIIYYEFCRILGLDYYELKFKNIYHEPHLSGCVRYETEVLINWNRKSLNDVLTTIAHELVHVIQILNGTLEIDHKNKICYFYNKSFDVQTFTYDDYYNWPWEIEARKLSNEYVALFLEVGDPHVIRKIRSNKHWDVA